MILPEPLFRGSFIMNFQQAEQVLFENGWRYYYNKMLSGRSYDDPNGVEVFLSEKEVIQLAEEISNS